MIKYWIWFDKNVENVFSQELFFKRIRPMNLSVRRRHFHRH